MEALIARNNDKIVEIQINDENDFNAENFIG